ncbi:uncharacterized protein KY384_005259 [Bacidia gigantensis]|uniref:uncharacterized protein n=1 Tax=Bacidia gigantensis TaxID=2732470 RepID=UPI001D05AAE8|nr:uncharacterized protein KY384_005259 [Bacidia gigantensis]KAG8529778.1 hypothetical protein KY384_005259 [Bacidia gigantensis]
MACIVTGFPSSIAALQFEWAWTHAHKTTHISEDERITRPPPSKGNRTRKAESPKSAKAQTHRKKKPRKPNWTMRSRLMNLHLLLRVPAFNRWPLSLSFFCDDVYHDWQRFNKQASGEIRKGVKIFVDDHSLSRTTLSTTAEPSDTKVKQVQDKEPAGVVGPQKLEITYRSMKDHLEKSLSLIEEGEVLVCSVCSQSLTNCTSTTLFCPHESCRAVTHISCLSSKFLQDEGSGGSVIPISGHCPACERETSWVSLVKEMTLRQKGLKEVSRLLKPKRRRVEGEVITAALAADDADLSSAEEESERDDVPLADNWQLLDDDDDAADDDAMSVSSLATDCTSDMPRPHFRPPTWRLDKVVEDSDGDEFLALE